jgi:hypothetical protein
MFLFLPTGMGIFSGKDARCVFTVRGFRIRPVPKPGGTVVNPCQNRILHKSSGRALLSNSVFQHPSFNICALVCAEAITARG